MFGEQAMRLLREKWRSATLLAEELYAMFQDDIPLTHKAPLTIRTDGPGASLRVINRTGPSSQFDGDVIVNRGGMTFNNPGGPAITVNNYRAGDNFFRLFNPDGTDAGHFFSDGDDLFWQDKNDEAPQRITNPQVQGTGNCFPGEVLSGGPGATYTVRITTEAGQQDVTVTQLVIDAAETIPAGTKDLVTRVGNAYSMQVPTWGPP